MRYCLGPPDAFGNAWAALGLMPLGLFFDFMDGKVARWRHKSSLMGQELDSLADLVGLRLLRAEFSILEARRLRSFPCTCPFPLVLFFCSL